MLGFIPKLVFSRRVQELVPRECEAMHDEVIGEKKSRFDEPSVLC